jgi:hypothetical protein
MTAADPVHAIGGRQTGHGWTACCPAQDNMTPRLAIREAHAEDWLRKLPVASAPEAAA